MDSQNKLLSDVVISILPNLRGLP